MYRGGHAELMPMAYFCLSVLKWSTGYRTATRKEAARRYVISLRVLDTLGALSSGGDRQTARKLRPGIQPRPHSEADKRWIEAAVRALIKRVGEWAAAPTKPMPELTMADLPKLPLSST